MGSLGERRVPKFNCQTLWSPPSFHTTYPGPDRRYPSAHTATITSLVERLDEAAAKGAPRNISELTERLEIVESNASAPEDLTRLTDRVTSIERRLPAPGVIAGLQQQLQEVAMRFALLEKPAVDDSEARRWPLYVLAVLAVAAIAALIVMAAI